MTPESVYYQQNILYSQLLLFDFMFKENWTLLHSHCILCSHLKQEMFCLPYLLLFGIEVDISFSSLPFPNPSHFLLPKLCPQLWVSRQLPTLLYHLLISYFWWRFYHLIHLISEKKIDLIHEPFRRVPWEIVPAKHSQSLIHRT